MIARRHEPDQPQSPEIDASSASPYYNVAMSAPKHQQPPAEPKPDDPEQYRRFVEMAREVGADESPEAMGQAFAKVCRSKPAQPDPVPVASRRSERGQ